MNSRHDITTSLRFQRATKKREEFERGYKTFGREALAEIEKRRENKSQKTTFVRLKHKRTSAHP